MKRVEPHQNFEETIQRVIIFNNVICIIFGDFLFFPKFILNLCINLFYISFLLQLKNQKARKKVQHDKGIHDRNKDITSHAMTTNDMSLNNYTKHPQQPAN